MMNLWHGSEHRFDEFDMSKIGTGDGRSIGGWGLYFSDSKSVADRYYLPKGQLDIWQVEVRPNRMFDFDGYGEVYDAVLGELDGSNIEAQATEFRDEYQDCNGKQIYDWLSYALGGEKEASMFLKAAGFDGVVMRDKWNTDATNYIMFDTSRIRGKVEDDEMYEDGEAPGPGYSTLDSVPGMGAPVLPTRTSVGSGDVPMPSKRTKRFKEFKKTRKKK